MIHRIELNKTFRFVQHGTISNNSILLYVLHGYGQLPEFFCRKFMPLPEDVVLIAPEGMHRFYLQGTSGRVGASWMTKESREDDIQDNIQFLNTLDAKLTADIQPLKRIVLGFSQGGATAARWKAHAQSPIDHLIMWAAIFPPDLEKEEFSQESNKHHFVIGDKDPYFTENQLEQTCNFYTQNNFTTHCFSGVHDINKEVFNRVLKTCLE